MLGTAVVTEMCYVDRFFDGSNHGKFEGLLHGGSLISANEKTDLLKVNCLAIMKASK